MSNSTSRVERAVADLAAGRAIVLTGEGGADPDGYLVVAGEKAGTSVLAFMIRHTSGFVCAAVTAQVCARLGLPSPPGTLPASGYDFTVSVDAATGVSTGISAADRARTLRRLADPASEPTDFTRPGHVVPVLVHSEGVLGRPRAAEATVELLRAGGLPEVGALAALVSDTDPTGTAGPAESSAFATGHGLNWVSIADVASYRRGAAPAVRQTFRTVRDSAYGTIEEFVYHSDATDIDYVAYRISQDATRGPMVHPLSGDGIPPDHELDSVFAGVLSTGDDAIVIARRTMAPR